MSFIPLLNFNGNCREAMLFYQDCFGGDLRFRMLSETLEQEQLQQLKKDYVLSARLDAPFISILGSDMVSDLGVIEGTRISLLCRIDNQQELNRIIQGLSGKSMAEASEWVSVADKFGVQWVFETA